MKYLQNVKIKDIQHVTGHWSGDIETEAILRALRKYPATTFMYGDDHFDTFFVEHKEDYEKTKVYGAIGIIPFLEDDVCVFEIDLSMIDSDEVYNEWTTIDD